jgi:hypothetical protein
MFEEDLIVTAGSEESKGDAKKRKDSNSEMGDGFDSNILHRGNAYENVRRNSKMV